MSNISSWSPTAASNNSTPPDGWPEGQQANTVNDCAREMMGALARWYQDTDGSLTSTGSSNAYVLTSNSAYAALTDQAILVFRSNHANTGAATLNVDSLGAKSIKKNHDEDLVSGDIEANQIVAVVYNATDDAYELVSSVATAPVTADGTQTLTNKTLTGNLGAHDIGDVKPTIRTTAPTGWLLCYGQTIGDVGSGADVESADYGALFDLVKLLPPNAGTEVFANGDAVALPDLRGRVVAGKDDMGGTSANRLTDQSGGVDGDILGDTGGAETHALTTAQLAAHGHSYQQTIASGGGGLVVSGGIASIVSGTTGDAGSGQAHNNVQPTIILNYIIFAGA